MLVIVLVAPLVAIGASPWAAYTGLFYSGMIPAIMGLLISTRAALVANLLVPAGMVAGLVLSPHPLLGTLFMVVLAAAVGASSRLGWHGIGASLGPWVALALIDPPTAYSLRGAIVLAGLALSGGLWATIVGRLILREVSFPRLMPVGPLAAGYFAAALAVLVGGATFVSMTQMPGTNAWWTVLTLFVVVQPDYAASLGHVSARVGGTLAGAVAASALGNLLGSHTLLITAIAVALSVASAVAYLTRPYWVYVLLLTPAVILLSAQGQETILDVGLQRALFTLGAAVAATAVLVLGHRILPAGHRAGRAPR